MNIIKECKLEESVVWNLYTHDRQFLYIYFYVGNIQNFYVFDVNK